MPGTAAPSRIATLIRARAIRPLSPRRSALKLVDRCDFDEVAFCPPEASPPGGGDPDGDVDGVVLAAKVSAISLSGAAIEPVTTFTWLRCGRTPHTAAQRRRSSGRGSCAAHVW
jgi:hypothetical protein